MSKQKPYNPTQLCEWCGNTTKGIDRRFCGRKCSAIERNSKPEEVMKRTLAVREYYAHNPNPRLGVKDPQSSIRMTLHNPMQNPETREKVSKALTGKKLPHLRGGNGQGMTVPQTILLERLNYLIPEHVISMKGITHPEGVPSHYKIDLADLENKLAIEIDGYSHNTYKQKIKDLKKDSILQSLGWKVLRFKNKQILDELEHVVTTIQSMI